MSILLNSSWWLVPLCLCLAAIPAFFLYQKSFYQKESKRLAYGLMVLRFVAFFMLFFLLLEPLIKTTQTRTEKPIVVVLADNSLSVKTGKDSVALKKAIPERVKELQTALESKYDVSVFKFGDGVEPLTKTLLFDEKLTNISKALDEVYTRFYNRNLGAVVLLTDGIYNRGINPLTSIKKFKNVSFYTVGLGDTLITHDLVLADMLYNKTAYLGNDYPVEVIVHAKKMQGVRAQLVLKENGREVYKRELLIQTANQTLRTSFLLPAKKEGQQKITAEIIPVDGEFSHKNNALSVYVNVIKNKQKVLVLAAAPNPDVAAIKYALESSQNYQVNSLVYTPGAPYTYRDYNLIVLHGLPTNGADEELIKKIQQAGVPILFVVSSQTSVSSLSKMAGIVSILGTGKNSNTVQPVLNPNFTSFTLAENTKRMVNKFPPLAVPFGDYKTSPGANVLFYQRIGTVNTNNPCIVFNKDNNNGNKIGIVCGEGMWRWKMRDYELNQNNEVFNEIVQKTVQYLSVVENKSNFRVNHKNEFQENEPIIFDAELLNESYEPINEPDVKIQIINAEKKVFNYTFSRVSNTYRLNAGLLPAGEYGYTANVSYGGKNYTKAGKFMVTAINAELLRTEADHRLLYQMASFTGGKFYTYNATGNLVNDISKNENVTAITYEEKTLDDLINKKWLIVLPVLLLALEWFLRKRAGGY